MASEIQTIIFSKKSSPSDVNKGKGWTASEARSWLKANDFKSFKTDETDSAIRFRQFPPSECSKESFITLTKDFPAGISAVACDRAASKNAVPEPEVTERRTIEITDGSLLIEKREGQPVRLKGYAAVFGQKSLDLGGFREVIEPGAFAESLGKEDIRALWNHNTDKVLARNRAGTLRLHEDARGLAFELELPNTSWASDIAETVGRGDVSQMSFGFRTLTDAWTMDEGLPLRTLKKLKLREISPVAFPAYPQTDVALRGLQDWQAGQGGDDEGHQAAQAALEEAKAFEADQRARRIRLLEQELALPQGS